MSILDNENLSKGSLDYLSSTSIEKRNRLGQYLTPRMISELAVKHLPMKLGDKVLDPAVGTGELLLAVKRANPSVSLYGWDVDVEVLGVARGNLGLKAKLINQDALWVTDKNNFFDVVIANPPYFEMPISTREREAYGEVISGRANIFALFFKKAIELVKDEGYLAFIVPPSMNNGGYFTSLREYIVKNSEIKFIKVINDSTLFLEAQTSVQIIILQKKINPKLNKRYVVDLKKITSSPVSRYLFTEVAGKIEESWTGKSSIYNLGYTVITGSLPWNQHKTSLYAEQSEGFLLVYYSKDIGSDGKITFNPNMDKRRFMDSTKKDPLEGQAILVNRIVGGVGVGALRAAMVKGKYYAENHVNVIIPRVETKQLVSLPKLHKALTSDPSIKGYLQAFTGNTQLSASELKYFIPIEI